jgi:hypothetical protein
VDSARGHGVECSAGNPPDSLHPAIPLITKGRGDSDGDEAVDIYYFMGLANDRGYVLAADFEEAAAGANPSQNQPVRGTVPIETGRWYHVAATFDGSVWRLYVDGNLDVMLDLGAATPPASNSGVGTAIGTSLRASGGDSGSFDGLVDELRVWGRALDESEIRAGGAPLR